MVEKFTNILVPYDDSQNARRALKKAIAFASLVGATITLVHVISYHKAIAKIIQPYKGKLITHVKHFMNNAKKQALRDGIILDQKILYGSPSEEIIKLTNKKKFDLMIMGKRGTTKITGPSLGSVSNAMVQNSKVPVMIVV
mgnify:CR=1 FL=1